MSAGRMDTPISGRVSRVTGPGQEAHQRGAPPVENARDAGGGPDGRTVVGSGGQVPDRSDSGTLEPYLVVGEINVIFN